MLITVVLCRIVDLKVTTHRSACYAQLQSNRPFFLPFLLALLLRMYASLRVESILPLPLSVPLTILFPSRFFLSTSLLCFSPEFLGSFWLELCCVLLNFHTPCALCSIISLYLRRGFLDWNARETFFPLFWEFLFFLHSFTTCCSAVYIWDFSAFSSLPLSLTLSHSRPFLMLILDTTPRARVLTDWYILCLPFFSLSSLQNTTCKHPIVMLAGVSASDLEALLEFVYRGEVSVDHSQLPSLLQAAQCLNIQGLAPQTVTHKDDGGYTSIQIHPGLVHQDVKTHILEVGGNMVRLYDTLESRFKIQICCFFSCFL